MLQMHFLDISICSVQSGTKARLFLEVCNSCSVYDDIEQQSMQQTNLFSFI